MIESIGTQHIRRRRRPAPAASYKPLDKIKQKPVHKKRTRQREKIAFGFKGFSGLRRGTGLHLGVPLRIRFPNFFFTLFRKKKVSRDIPAENPGAAGRQSVSSGRKIFADAFLRLMFPALITAAIGLFVLILYCSFAQTGEKAGAFVAPREDSGFQVNMASYAGISPQMFRESGGSPAGDDIPLDLRETFSWLNYTVKRGDSVSKIAAAYGISMDAIIASNGITNVRRLYQGQVIKIPNMDGIPYTVRAGDSLLKISSSMNVPLEAILDANDIQSENITPGTALFIPGARMRTEDLKLALGELFIYPIRGRLTSPFGWRNDPISGVRRYHAAIDLASPIGTPVKAAMDGRVSTVGYNGTYGKFIILKHVNGFQTMYAHLSVVSVTQGSPVNQGTKIGEVGNTGYSTGPHLHFQVFKNGSPVNPLDLLSP